MNVHGIMMQKLAEIQSRLPVSINKNIDSSNGVGTVSNDGSLNKVSDFGNILNDSMSKINTTSSDSTSSLSSENNVNDDSGIKSSSMKDKLLDMVKPYMNIPYVWGGTTTKGFDCSGFTKYIMNKLGVDLNRVAKDQAKQGEYVPRSELKEGDLIFFDTKGNGVSHVGMYLGNGEFVHASSAAKKVTISSLNDSFYNKAYVTGRRMLTA